MKLTDYDYFEILGKIIKNPGIQGKKISGLMVCWVRTKIEIFYSEGLIRKDMEKYGIDLYITDEGLEKYKSVSYLEEEVKNKELAEINIDTLGTIYRPNRHDIIEKRKEWLNKSREQDKKNIKNKSQRIQRFKNRKKE